MRREEMLELIQRDLDGDLTNKEKRDLLFLVQRDPDAQLLYNRLHKISSDLASLPAVVPPFSIVDSILPMLGNTSQDTTIAAATNGIKMPTLERRKETAEPATRKKIPAWVVKTGSGVAAACVLFGLFVMVNNHFQRNSAGNSKEIVVDTPTNTPPTQKKEQKTLVLPNQEQKPEQPSKQSTNTSKPADKQQTQKPAKRPPNVKSITDYDYSDKKRAERNALRKGERELNKEKLAKDKWDRTDRYKTVPSSVAALEERLRQALKGSAIPTYKKEQIISPAQKRKEKSEQPQEKLKKKIETSKDHSKNSEKDKEKEKQKAKQLEKRKEIEKQMKQIRDRIKESYIEKGKGEN